MALRFRARRKLWRGVRYFILRAIACVFLIQRSATAMQPHRSECPDQSILTADEGVDPGSFCRGDHQFHYLVRRRGAKPYTRAEGGLRGGVLVAWILVIVVGNTVTRPHDGGSALAEVPRPRPPPPEPGSMRH